jgi:hypothetical protein
MNRGRDRAARRPSSGHPLPSIAARTPALPVRRPHRSPTLGPAARRPVPVRRPGRLDPERLRTGRRRPERNHPEPDRSPQPAPRTHPAIPRRRWSSGARRRRTRMWNCCRRPRPPMFVQAGVAPTLCRPPPLPRELQPGRWAATGAGGTPSVGHRFCSRGASRLVHGNTDCRVQLSSREPSDGRETLPCGRRSGRLSATTTRETPQR